MVKQYFESKIYFIRPVSFFEINFISGVLCKNRGPEFVPSPPNMATIEIMKRIS
jgi:hypothetical protein